MASVTKASSHWSNCSRADLHQGLHNLNLKRCLYDVPEAIIGNPVCGNGIQEDGELCDCGTVDVSIITCISKPGCTFWT